ncbi:MAG: hypothetical protein ACE5EK_05760 [Nitrospinales bacterium]
MKVKNQNGFICEVPDDWSEATLREKALTPVPKEKATRNSTKKRMPHNTSRKPSPKNK